MDQGTKWGPAASTDMGGDDEAEACSLSTCIACKTFIALSKSIVFVYVLFVVNPPSL